MIRSHAIITFLILLAGLTTGYFAARGVIDYLAISFREKDLSGLDRVQTGGPAAARGLPLRIVDLGGVGVLPDTARWGSSYAHNQHYFEDVMKADPPFVNVAAFQREQVKLDHYAEKMAGFGYNAMALPWFLEVVNFDLEGDGTAVYPAGNLYRSRHDTLTRRFRELMQTAADHGMGTYLWTDMVALTPPLESYLLERFGSVDTENSELWQVYARGAEELFAKFPHLEGIILRIGEAGSVYNLPGWDYKSELYVRTDRAVRLMLEAFLSAAEKYDRTIIFRTWSVGVGQVGDMHTNPETYARVLGGIRSGHLVVSTKYCNGDFYSWLGTNPTLFAGDHRRIVEFQAKREYEGFGALPNYLGPLHQGALQNLVEKNPRVEGVWVWTQYGGPLRAGPLIIYPFYGFNVINDLNTYATSRLVMDPYADLDSITAGWIEATFGPDPLLVANLSAFFNASHGVVQEGLYISEFAKYEVRAMGLEPPPMLWIFEWDILGASSAVFSNIWFVTRDHFREVTDEGFQAVKDAVTLRDLLLEVRERVTLNKEDYDRLVASAAYEIELFRLLDYYRQFFMEYYRWIDSGDAGAKSGYRLAMGQFKSVMDYHEARHAGDLNALGMDFEEVRSGIRIAERTALSVRISQIVLVVAIFLLVMGIPGFVRERAQRRFAGTLYFDALFRPFRISGGESYHGTGRLVGLMGLLYILGWSAFSSFTAIWFPLCMVLSGYLFVVPLALLLNPGHHFRKILITLLGPKLVILALILSAVAVRGPVYFWYLVWVSDPFKLILLSLLVMLIFRKFQVYIILARRWGRRNLAASVAMVFMVLGFQLLVAGVALQLVGLEESLTALNNELLVLPGGLSKIMGITTHLGIPPEVPGWIIGGASVIALTSLLVYLLSARSREPAGFGIS